MKAPLHPRGSLRARFLPPTTTDVFRRLGVGAQSCDLGDEGLYLAEELVAADAAWLGASGRSDQPEALAILVLALMIAQDQGSTRLPLDTGRTSTLRQLTMDIARIAGIEIDLGRVLRIITNLTSAPRFNSVIGIADARQPLVVDDGCLYTERSRWLEQRVAVGIGRRIRMTGRVGAARSAMADLVAHPAQRPLTDEQARAVELALGSSLAVVTGGPGTGKTVVAASIVRGFARMGIANVALAAQTGKAANRLTQVIAEQLAAIAEPTDIDRALLAAPPAALTLHRLLGYRGKHAANQQSPFAYHALSPLPVGAVIVDEASMIDLELVDALLDALPAEAPLILVGDAHQLPAIDAGQILADLADPEGPAAQRVGVLAKSFRMDTSDLHGRAVYLAARAIHEGNVLRLCEGRAARPSAAGRITEESARTLLATPRTPGTLRFEGVEWVDTLALVTPVAPSTPFTFDAATGSPSRVDTTSLPAVDAATGSSPRVDTTARTAVDTTALTAVDAAFDATRSPPIPSSLPRSRSRAKRSSTPDLFATLGSRSADSHPNTPSSQDALGADHPDHPNAPGADHFDVPGFDPDAPGFDPGTMFDPDEQRSGSDPHEHPNAPGSNVHPHAPHVRTARTKTMNTAHDVTLAVAEATWHHFEGPRALRAGERVFRFVDGVVVPEQRDELEALWTLLQRARILTVTRALPTGSLAINAHLHELALERLSVDGQPELVPGEPVMVTANDYQRGLFNGDQGIVIRADEGLGRHHYRVVFRAGGELRPFAIEALRDRLELAWALTVHKSQGSELDAIALLLPHDDLPLLTRELLYTGVTRARRSVVIAGAKSILVNGGKRRALRHSGLGGRLRAILRS